MLFHSDELNLFKFIVRTGLRASASQSLLWASLAKLGPLEDSTCVAQIQQSFEPHFLIENPLLTQHPRTTITTYEELHLSLVQVNMLMFPSVIAEHAFEGASVLSKFFGRQLPPLRPSKRPYIEPKNMPVEVFNGDTFVITRGLMDAVGNDAKGKTAILSLASDRYPGGGWEAGYINGQETYLCYSSTLFHSLTQPNIVSYYPWPNTGPGCVAGIFSEGVVIFREPMDARSVLGSSDDSIGPISGGYNSKFASLLPSTKRRVVSVISIAAPSYPRLSLGGNDFADDVVKEELKEKVRLALRMAALHGKRYLVLGALGCGTYLCPPISVAGLMKSVLLEKEFQGWFARIIFAVLSANGTPGDSNFEIFTNVLSGTKV
ncbi:hypothetical protein GYMLUDRAFT_909453 [Collybiopsis luxurians FD-317 M1]|nr:hypothetical protein GYMLUDRAFT_909453 [Collybiopsis luxurians FD-317 M1]